MTDASLALYEWHQSIRTWHCVLFAIGDARNTENLQAKGTKALGPGIRAARLIE